jgi:hypothetical protein
VVRNKRFEPAACKTDALPMELISFFFEGIL